MRRLLSTIVLLLSMGVFAQQEKEKSLGVDTLSLAKESPAFIFDSDDVEFANNVPSHTFLKDSVVFRLYDNPEAAIMDSIWQRELLKSSLYSDFNDELLKEEYNEVAFKELPTDTLKKRLKILDAKTPLKVEYNPRLENRIKSYLKRNKKAIEHLMALSTYYFPMFEQRLDKYNIPLEIKYLAIVESSLNPRARSRVGATGLWQFMYATGKMHGLEVSSYVDERMDPIMATEAAAKYLSTLYKVFNDWDLVLASYNSGPGNVSKAIRRSGGSTNYWDLRPHLPRETANYVPAFLSIMYIFEYAEEHGFQPPRTDISYFETDTIHTRRLLSFEEISQVTGVDKEILQFLNPSYKLDVIPNVPDEEYTLRLPREKVGLFVNNEMAIYNYAEAQREEEQEESGENPGDRIRYKVRRGDYLGRIAERYGVGVSSIKRWNNLRSNRLRIGQHLTIYPQSSNTASASTGSSPRIYTVKNGDSLWSISRKFPGLTIKKIKNWNNMSTTRLKPGMKLKVSEG